MEGLRSWNLGLPHGDLSTVLNAQAGHQEVAFRRASNKNSFTGSSI